SGRLPRYSPRRSLSLANCAAVILAAEMPEGWPLSAAWRLLEVRISPGALASRLVMSSRPRSSSAARTRSPARGPSRTSAGVGAEEARGVDDLAVGDGVVLADVVAFDAVAPGAGFSGRAEDGEVIFFGVAALAAVLFLNAEDVFEAHDGNGLHESGLAEPGA